MKHLFDQAEEINLIIHRMDCPNDIAKCISCYGHPECFTLLLYKVHYELLCQCRSCFNQESPAIQYDDTLIKQFNFPNWANNSLIDKCNHFIKIYGLLK